VTVLVSVVTPRTKSDDDLRGLVYSLTKIEHEHDAHWYERPAVLGMLILSLVVGLSILFW
jgi:solute:Na+ symporter, SSS family